MQRWSAIVFDLDDTLYPEREYVRSGFRAVAGWIDREAGLPAEETLDALWGLFLNGRRGRIFDEWLENARLPRDWVPYLVAEYREHVPDIQPFPGIREILAGLRGSASVGLVSDGYLTVQRQKFECLALGEFFDAVVFSDLWGQDAWKPSEVPFRQVLDRLGVRPQQSVYIGDNPTKDFIGARACGMSTIWARYSAGEYCRRECPSPAHAADLVVETLSDLELALGHRRVGATDAVAPDPHSARVPEPGGRADR